jgi:transcriptional regulator with XRE-family HTH domain
METPLSDADLVGKRLRQARKTQGLTVEQLAQRLQLSAQAVKKWESGAATVQFAKLGRLARILNTTPDALLGFPSSVPIERLRPVLKSLFVVLNIPRDEAEKILDQIEEILMRKVIEAPDLDENVVLQVIAESRFRETLYTPPPVRTTNQPQPTDC